MNLGLSFPIKSKFNLTTQKIEIEKLYGQIQSAEIKNEISVTDDEALKTNFKCFAIKTPTHYPSDAHTK